HLLDAIAKDFGEQCYEVPVGFKHISSKMVETNAVIGGESSGGLTVRGHIQGKDGIYAAALLVEMIATTGCRLSQVYKEITDKYGCFEMDERDYRFTEEKKQEILQTLMEDKLLPQFAVDIERVTYSDGCKIYFKNGGWLSARFSGTEPLMRIFCEMGNMHDAQETAYVMEKFLEL
ncbi:MAG: phosphoglucomutase/phosphomannomutase family protein, partial [Angelakisella sp.]